MKQRQLQGNLTLNVEWYLQKELTWKKGEKYIIPKFSQPYSAPGETTADTYSLSRSQ